MRSKWFAPICIVGMILVTAVLYSQLPAQIPTHWGINGAVDATGDKSLAVLLFPAIGLMVWLLMLGLPLIDPMRESYQQFQSTYRLIFNLIVLFLAGFHVLILGAALGWNVPIGRYVLISVGLLLALIGNQFGRIQPNWFMGIRTPWTLSDPEVWKQTHRLGGRVFVIAGVLTAILAVFLPLELATPIFIVGILCAVIIPLAYSYITWRHLHA